MISGFVKQLSGWYLSALNYKKQYVLRFIYFHIQVFLFVPFYSFLYLFLVLYLFYYAINYEKLYFYSCFCSHLLIFTFILFYPLFSYLLHLNIFIFLVYHQIFKSLDIHLLSMFCYFQFSKPAIERTFLIMMKSPKIWKKNRNLQRGFEN